MIHDLNTKLDFWYSDPHCSSTLIDKIAHKLNRLKSKLFSTSNYNHLLFSGGQFLRNARAVAFNPEPSESLEVLTRVLQVFYPTQPT